MGFGFCSWKAGEARCGEAPRAAPTARPKEIAPALEGPREARSRRSCRPRPGSFKRNEAVPVVSWRPRQKRGPLVFGGGLAFLQFPFVFEISFAAGNPRLCGLVLQIVAKPLK